MYYISSYKIKIPSSSKLPDYQRLYPLYDRFLPVLAKNLNMDGIIVDVGANVGDTLIAMMQRCDNNFVCIEPSNFFFRYLEENVQRLSTGDKKRVQLIQALVGSGSFSGVLQKQQGTAKVILDMNSKDSSCAGLPATCEPNILKYNNLDGLIQSHSDVILLKSDVDGYDFDVIASAKRILLESEPILFFENQIDNDFQYVEFNKFYDFLWGGGLLQPLHL
jgi:FkbM family methyltransferase